MNIVVIVFPGSNCDRDAKTGIASATGAKSQFVWHRETELPKGTDLVMLPGGFSYGDYLRSGAIAAHAPVMQAVKAHADKGGLVLGVCNGFQILTEAGLLPGALLRNRHLKFVCKQLHIQTVTTASPFTKALTQGSVLHVPVAHHDGNYAADEATLKALQDQDRIAFRYCDEVGNVTPEANPNGSLDNIAGVLSEKRNVLGMMPHPERACELLLGSHDGARIFKSLLAA